MRLKHINIIYIYIYKLAVTTVKAVGGMSSDFPIMIGLQQGSALGPYLFALFMDAGCPSGRLFMDNILFNDETRILGRSTLES